MSNYYQILGVSESATTAEIKSAYRVLAKKYHPDLNDDPKAQELFITVEVAYSCLVKADTRRSHDMILKYQRQAQRPTTAHVKFQRDVNKRAEMGRARASERVKMDYAQYRRDELFRTSSLAIVIQSVFTIITGAGLLILFMAWGNWYYDMSSRDWPKQPLAWFLSFVYIALLLGMTYVYEPMIKRMVVGKPSKMKSTA